MTRSEMVIDFMTKSGAAITGGSESSYKKKREYATTIHSGDVRMDVTKTYLYIEHKLTNDVLYHGLIPPNKIRFEELMSWIGVKV